MRRGLLLGWMLGLAACGGGGEDYGPDDPGPSEPPPIPNHAPAPPPTALVCTGGTHLTYENFGEAFLLNFCTSCHSQHAGESQRAGAPVGSNFDTPSDAQLWRALMLTKTGGEAPTMPPSAQVPALEKVAFTEWLNCGAPAGKDRLK